MVSDAGGQAAATAAMDQSAFAHMERMLRDETKGEYTVGKMLGRGGMAVVYLAEETRLGRKVALKVLPPELTFGHGVDRFLREAKTAATLDHPHIIPIYRIASGGKLFWYAMKFLEGKSLEDVLRERGKYTVEETIEVLEQVADALDYAHEHQVIHRDIKPANVMLDSRNRVIITDFGIAKALSEGALTASGSVIGTPYFMSPEQGMGKPVAGAADQYSVAVMAYRMLSGHIPYDGDSAIDILHKHCMMEVPRLDEDVEGIPKHVADAIEKAMAKKAPERFPDIRTFVKALKDPNLKYTRASAQTVVIDSKELEKANSGPLPKVKARGAAAAADRTVVASPVAAGKAAPRTAPTPAKSSKMPLVAAALVVVLGGGGFGAWKMGLIGGGASAAPSGQVANGEPNSATGTQANPTVTPPPVVPDTTVNAPAAQTPPADNPAPSNQKSAPPTNPTRNPTNSPTRNPATTPNRPTTTPQTQPNTTANTSTGNPASTPASTPATTPATPPAEAAPTGPATLQLVLSTPATIFIDGVSKGERRTLQEQLTPGDHLIKIQREGFVTVDTAVTLRAGPPQRVNITLQPRP